MEYGLFEWELVSLKGMGSGKGWDPTMERQKEVCWMTWLWGSEDVLEKG